MRRWIGGTSPVWPDRSWQVYALPARAPGLAHLARAYRPVLRRWPAHLSPVELVDYLHATVQPLPGWAADYPPDRISEIASTLRADLVGAGPVTVPVGPALAGSAGVLLDVPEVTGGPLEALVHRVRDAVARATATGVADLPRSGWPAHLSLAYCTHEIDSGDVQSALRRVRDVPLRASWTIDTLWLVDVRQDPEAHTYTWTTAIPLPLGA